MLEGKRLMLYPLEADDLAQLLHERSRFEELHRLTYDGELLEGTELFGIFEGQIEVIRTDPAHWLWHTFWMMIDHQNNIVGSICFKGPAIKGEVEIGYGVSVRHAGKGYASEAVGTLTAWGLVQHDVDAVIAETEHFNDASKRVLAKNGFVVYKTTESALWWRKEGTQ
jgi:RimJ/RimL family protein N-acetyltransferase